MLQGGIFPTCIMIGWFLCSRARNMNPKDIVYKMVVLGRRLTTHFILDIFWGSSFMFHVVSCHYYDIVDLGVARASACLSYLYPVVPTSRGR